MVESSEESLLGSHESKCCWCPAESRNMWFVWRNSSLKINFLHPWESDIQNRCENLTTRPEQKYWIKLLKDIQLRKADLAWFAMGEQELIGCRSGSLRGANITQVWSSLKDAHVPNYKPQASRRHEPLVHVVKGSLTWNSCIKGYTKQSVELVDISCCFFCDK